MEPINGDSDQRPPADREVHELFDRARTVLNAGDVEHAEKLASQALEKEPDFLPALELAGVLACQLRQFDRGIIRLRRLNELMTDHPGALFNLGNALVSNREFSEGLQLLERADRLSPGNPNVAVAIGIALRNLGRIREAVARLEAVVQVAPQHLAALNSLGSCHAQLGQFEKASSVFQQAVSISPRSIELRHNAANMLLELGEFAGAANEYRAALTVDSRNPDSRMGLAMALDGMGEFDEALYHLRKVLKSQPDNLHARYAVVDTLEHMSRLAEARSELDRVLSEHPQNINFLFLDLRLAMRGDDARGIEERVERLAGENVPSTLAPRLYAELGAAYDRLNRADDAMQAFTTANKASAEAWRQHGSSPNRFRGRTNAVRAWVESLEALPRGPDSARTPVFVLGFPRSGTTLMGRILHQHSALWAADERPSLRMLVDDLEAEGRVFPNDAASLDDDRIASLRDQYFARFPALPEDHQLVDKMPLNIVYLPLIWRMFPNAQFVCMVRDPRDVILSCYMQPFALNAAMANFHTLENAAALYDEVQAIWKSATALMDTTQIHVCHYESLVADPQTTVEALCRFLGIAFEEAMLRPEKASAKGVLTPSLRQIARPMNTESVGRHRRYAGYLKQWESTLNPWIEHFGYGESRET